MNKHELMYQRIEKHGEQLKKVFNLDTNTDPVKLCKSLFRLENKAHNLAIKLCNGWVTQEEYEKEEAKIITNVGKFLFPIGTIPDVPIFFNGDPRGYALKIDDTYMRENNIELYRDMGGYGIIAPDFREGL